VSPPSATHRVIGVDPGRRRIGVALGTNGVASPLEVIHRTSSLDADLRRLVNLVDEWEATAVVVGLPLTLNGDHGPAAAAATTLAERLARLTSVPVEMHDERLTTVTAERAMVEAGLDGVQRRRSVDKVAAAVMLQSWLDARAGA
jgi:putative Holliday junction resolvase